MTYQLAALRFRSVGERSARFTDLTLDLTAPTDEGALPHDSVVWLRNGGGKSSILSLLYAQLLPRANDFMGRAVQRHLTDYVDSGDTSHVTAVWQPMETARTLLGDPEDVLITGVVHEWADLRRPVKATESRDRLNSSFYLFRMLPSLLDLENLPFTDEAGKPRRASAFLEALKNMAKPHMRHADLVVTDKQYVWNKALLDRHLDPEIFRIQKQMNHVEGGVEDMFKFPAAKDFIDFLLDLTTQPEAPAGVARRLASVTELLSAKPRKIEERDFCNAAATGLDEVDSRHRKLQSANDELSAADMSAMRLASSFASSVAKIGADLKNLESQKKVIQEQRSAANNERSQSGGLLYLYRREAARLRLREAEAEERSAYERAEEARATSRAWEATGKLAAFATLEGELAQAELDAAAEENELAPLREEHARKAVLLKLRLARLAEEADFGAELADEQRGTSLESAAAEKELAGTARAERDKAAADETKARERLTMLAQQISRGVERGHLPTESTSPDQHLTTVTEQQGRVDNRVTELSEQAEDRRRRRDKITARQTSLAHERSAAEHARTATAQRRAGLDQRLNVLTGSERLLELAETDDTTSIDLWSEAALLQRRLSNAALSADNERILRRAERHADQHTIEAQQRDHVLPPGLDTERVEHALTSAGIPTQAGWSHLREVVSADRLITLLDTPEVARLGCGVVVPTESVPEAVRTLNAQSVVTTNLVGLYSVEAADAIIHGGSTNSSGTEPAWTALQPGLVDPVEAEATVRILKEQAHVHQRMERELAAQHDADEELRRAIIAFLDDCPAGHLEALNEEIDGLDQKITGFDEEAETLRLELQSLNDRDELDETRRAELVEESRRLGATIGWLEDLLPSFAEKESWQRCEADARLRKSDAVAQEETHDRAATQALLTAQAKESEASDKQRQAQRYRAESDEIPGSPDELSVQVEMSDDSAVPLDTLRHNQQNALSALRQRASASVLADRVQSLTQRVASARQELGTLTSQVREVASRLLASPEGQDRHLRDSALKEARAASETADREHGIAQGRVEQCEADLRTIEEVRQKPRRALPTVPVDSAQADSLAAEQEVLTQQAQEKVTWAEAVIQELDARIQSSGVRQKLLDTLLESLPKPGEDAVTEADLFTDDENTARERSREARNTITAAAKKVDTANAELTASVDQLRRTAARFPGVSGPVKDRVANDQPSVLGSHASDLADRLRLRAQTLDDELASIAQDQSILSEALAHLVKESLDVLAKAERASQMKNTSGSWSGKHILRITFDRPSESDLLVYAERIIDRTVQKGLKPEGMPMLKAAVHEAAGPRGFTVKVLKPTEDVTGTTEDISRLAKWSGGEKLTVCVALYCTLAALRAANTGRRGRSGGVLLLDNPIGRASSASLVRLQRSVAASHGVQLVYTTGVKDPAAVIQFPNVIRLENRGGRTRNRRYIVAEENGDDAIGVTGIRVAHNDHSWDDASGHEAGDI
ncbi:hypothetical protein MRI28_19915 [Nocardiopsis dassonvillei]|uniref:hypothetical protein n=1 Tax=Nocardiopsis dassonvillei TaxID=2014 RepID=UPI00200C5D0D|nr:hypothetical protein [Nocardiopsis dassonvillei]MCK9871876.1 hypothetical protein [Nocardiopsis dassonvillei]